MFSISIFFIIFGAQTIRKKILKFHKTETKSLIIIIEITDYFIIILFFNVWNKNFFFQRLKQKHQKAEKNCQKQFFKQSKMTRRKQLSTAFFLRNFEERPGRRDFFSQIIQLTYRETRIARYCVSSTECSEHSLKGVF